MPSTLTAGTITDEQIRSLRALVLTEPAKWEEHGFDTDDVAEDCDVALGGKPRGQFHPRSTVTAIIQTNAARARCAEIINARSTK